MILWLVGGSVLGGLALCLLFSKLFTWLSDEDDDPPPGEEDLRNEIERFLDREDP